MIRPLSLASTILAAAFVASLAIFVAGYANGVSEFLANDPRRQIPFAGTIVFGQAQDCVDRRSHHARRN